MIPLDVYDLQSSFFNHLLGISVWKIGQELDERVDCPGNCSDVGAHAPACASVTAKLLLNVLPATEG